jgi:hypothetical protein
MEASISSLILVPTYQNTQKGISVYRSPNIFVTSGTYMNINIETGSDFLLMSKEEANFVVSLI